MVQGTRKRLKEDAEEGLQGIVGFGLKARIGATHARLDPPRDWDGPPSSLSLDSFEIAQKPGVSPVTSTSSSHSGLFVLPWLGALP